MPDGTASVKPRFRLAIVGGGIAGLTLAVALGRREDPSSPVQIDIYESGTEITTVGAGITVWPRTWAIMRALGMYEDLSNEAVKMVESKGGNSIDVGNGGGRDEPKTGFVFRKSDWPRDGYEFGRVMVPNGATSMHRADMVDVFVRHLPASCTIHTSKRLTKYSEPQHLNGAYVLHFADGSVAEADVIVGADGIKSKTRASMYEYAHARECLGGKGSAGGGLTKDECERCRRANPKWTGTVAYRYLIPTEKMQAVNPKHHALEIKAPMSYSGRRKHIITYPISHGKYLNWIGFVTIPGAEGTPYPRKWVTDASRDELVAHFTSWEPEVDEMLSCVEKPTLWAIHEIDNLPFSVSGRVALMGDAVHAMTTHFGAGGGQAIEDAYILGLLLGNPGTTLAQVADILNIYQNVRLPFARRVVQNAHKVGLMYEFNWPGLYDGIDTNTEETKTRLAELETAIREIWQWQWKEPVQDQWKEAEQSLSEVLGSQGEMATRPRETTWWRSCIVM